MIASPYEQIADPAYWEMGIMPYPEIGRMAMWADQMSARSPVAVGRISGTADFMNTHSEATRRSLAVEGDVLPVSANPGKPALLQVVINERHRREGQPVTEPNPVVFNQRVEAMDQDPWYTGPEVFTTVPTADGTGHFMVTHSMWYAMTSRSGKQLVGIPSSSEMLDASSPDSLKGLGRVIPPLTVGAVYQDQPGGKQRDLRVAGARIITPLNSVYSDRPYGGEQNPTLGWLVRQHRLAAGQA